MFTYAFITDLLGALAKSLWFISSSWLPYLAQTLRVSGPPVEPLILGNLAMRMRLGGGLGGAAMLFSTFASACATHRLHRSMSCLRRANRLAQLPAFFRLLGPNRHSGRRGVVPGLLFTECLA